jgi:hypothetical protein
VFEVAKTVYSLDRVATVSGLYCSCVREGAAVHSSTDVHSGQDDISSPVGERNQNKAVNWTIHLYGNFCFCVVRRCYVVAQAAVQVGSAWVGGHHLACPHSAQLSGQHFPVLLHFNETHTLPSRRFVNVLQPAQRDTIAFPISGSRCRLFFLLGLCTVWMWAVSPTFREYILDKPEGRWIPSR